MELGMIGLGRMGSNMVLGGHKEKAASGKAAA